MAPGLPARPGCSRGSRGGTSGQDAAHPLAAAICSLGPGELPPAPHAPRCEAGRRLPSGGRSRHSTPPAPGCPDAEEPEGESPASDPGVQADFPLGPGSPWSRLPMQDIVILGTACSAAGTRSPGNV